MKNQKIVTNEANHSPSSYPKSLHRELADKQILKSTTYSSLMLSGIIPAFDMFHSIFEHIKYSPTQTQPSGQEIPAKRWKGKRKTTIKKPRWLIKKRHFKSICNTAEIDLTVVLPLF